ncbi:MAG: ribokinase [Bacteroidota bacterium]
MNEHTGNILVIGSSNTDLIANVERFPAAGETVEGKFFLQAMGGKGANQALAAHRLGGQVKFITCLGSDANGQNALKYYEHEGLDVSMSLVVDDVATGTAMILVNAQGENCIIITPGANHKLSADYIKGIEKEIASASMIMLQMEIPFETVLKVCELASRHKTAVLLNVAPARKVDSNLLKIVDILVVNETEIEIITGQTIESVGEEGVIGKIISMGATTVILTLGGRGCIVKSENINQFIPAFQVTAVDSTAAGDTFCGALVAQLSTGKELIEAVRFSTAAAAICVTRRGAQPSIPGKQEVDKFLKEHAAIAGSEIKTSNRG